MHFVHTDTYLTSNRSFKSNFITRHEIENNQEKNSQKREEIEQGRLWKIHIQL